ncbi:MAG TPA: hypothetical protein VM120_16510 [Bryobacteraceae bacterium]|nr:hypothetical protein [Bryobacteraceae bacterium]
MLFAPECSVQFAELRRQAAEQPLAAVLCADVLPKVAQREEVLRIAFTSASSEIAARLLDRVIDKPWVGSAGLHRALEIAEKTEPAAGVRLLRAAALHNPSVAIRQFPSLPAEVLEAVALANPGETVAIAGGNSPTAARLLEKLEDRPALQALTHLARNASVDLSTRQRAAVLLPALPEEQAIRFARNDQLYFAQLARMPDSDPHLEAFALPYMRDLRQQHSALASWKPQELYLLLVYGRAEVDEGLFRAAFDRMQKPPPNRPRLRAFLSDAVAYGRLEKLPGALLAQAMRGIDTLEEMILAAEVIDNAAKPQLSLLADAILKAPDTPFYGLLAARLRLRLPVAALASRAAPYQRFLDPPAFMAMGAVSLHRYFFYDDDDGVLSFEAFRRSYQNAAGWTFRDHRDYVHVTGKGANGRTIEIYANVPIDLAIGANRLRAEESAARQQTVTRLLGTRQPNVIVHRGHAFHLDKTLRYLTPQARLVFLGSCRGMGSVDEVIHSSNSAQMIATRGTGSHTVNDPLLKALNEQLLRSSSVQWPQFWRAQKARFHGNKLFNDYIPPDQNTAAILLKAYYAYLTD